MGRFDIPFGDEFDAQLEGLGGGEGSLDELGKVPKSKNVITSWAQSGPLMVNNQQFGNALAAEFHEVANYTVGFSLPNSRRTVGGATRGFRALATVKWFVKGNAITRKFHVGDGTSITGTADSVNVQIVDDTQGAPNQFDGITYESIITCTRGTRGSHKQPVFYDMGIQTVTPGTPVIVTIPDDIGCMSLNILATGSGLVVPLVNGAARVDITNGTATLEAFDPFRNLDWVPLAPDAVQVVLSVSPAFASPVDFSVYLGIDG